MWTTTALVAVLALAPAEAGELNLANVRSTHGVRGVPRSEERYLPGDRLVLTFDIEGITLDDTGRVRYSMALEVTDARGKVHFRQDPTDLEAVAALGGSRLPAFAEVDVGLEQPPGEYTLTVTVTDRASKRSRTLKHSFEVLPKAYGLVRLTTTSDPEGVVCTTLFGSGQTLWVTCGVVGFARDTGSGQPEVVFELRVLDEQGQPTAKPFSGTISKDVPSRALSLPGQFEVALNRPGKFSVEVTATDRIGKKTARLSFPLTVLP